MRIALATVQVPFIVGGAEILAASLRTELQRRGHEADVVSIPFKWYPPERILDCMLMGRMIDLTEVNGKAVDRVIALKFPAYYLEHPHKVYWILHQHRQAYDLFDTAFGDLHLSHEGRSVATEIRRWDNALLSRSKGLYAISEKVAERLRRYNGLGATVLYHPPANHERYLCSPAEDYVLYPGRFDPMKRQHLLVEALAQVKSPIRAVLIGSMSGPYAEQIRASIARWGLESRVHCMGVVDEERKRDLYARSLAVYNGVYDEDYGYLTLEAFCSAKPVLTHTDSGGPLEFVRHGDSGYVTEPDPGEIAATLDRLYAHRDQAAAFGRNGRQALVDRNVTWDCVVNRLIT